MPSTVIKKMEFNPQCNTLLIQYVSGQSYLYKNVPETVYKDLKASRVKGRFLKFFVKDKYPFEKLEITET